MFYTYISNIASGLFCPDNTAIKCSMTFRKEVVTSNKCFLLAIGIFSHKYLECFVFFFIPRVTFSCVQEGSGHITCTRQVFPLPAVNFSPHRNIRSALFGLLLVCSIRFFFFFASYTLCYFAFVFNLFSLYSYKSKRIIFPRFP